MTMPYFINYDKLKYVTHQQSPFCTGIMRVYVCHYILCDFMHIIMRYFMLLRTIT